MNGTRIRWAMVSHVAASFLAALVLCAVLTSTIARAQVSEGAAVPNFELKDMNGKSFKLADHLAKGPVLVDFWATWCKPCLRELPHLDALGKKYEKQGLTVAAVSLDESRSIAKVKSYVKTHDYRFHVLLDTNQDLFRKLGGRGMPYLVLISPEGQRLYTHTAYRDGDEKKLEARLIEVLGPAEPPAGSGEGKSAPR